MKYIVTSGDSGKAFLLADTLDEIRRYNANGEIDEDDLFSVPDNAQIDAMQLLGCEDVTDVILAIGGGCMGLVQGIM